MENEATTKTSIPARSGFRNFASGLHSRFGGVGFCILIFALPNPLSLYFFVPLCLSGHESIMQNKPNSPNNKTTATLFAAKVYEIKPPLGDSKKQTQTNPIPPPPSCAGKESRISERNAYPDLSGQHQRSRIQYRESSIFPILPCIHGFTTQNKANVKMGNINISTARTKAYPKEQRTMSNERYPKQTQSNPIPPRAVRNPGTPGRHPAYQIRHTKYACPEGEIRTQFPALLLRRRLAEHLLFNKLSQSSDQLLGICSFGPDLQPGPHGRRQHAHLHNTLAVHTGLPVADCDVTMKPVCNINKLHRRAHMQPVGVLYFNFRFANQFGQNIHPLFGFASLPPRQYPQNTAS